jgi:N-acetyl-anhydromuramyl-L-alanine amidase AmpD
MIATRTVQGTNSGPYLRHPKIVVMHSTRSGLAEFTDAQELGATINWFTNPDGASSHWVISETERARVVTDDLIAWHSTYLNSRAWGIELTQPTIDRPYRDGHYANVALVGWRYIKLGVAPKWLDYWDGDVSVSGFVAHEDTVQGRESGKSDPGPQFDRVRFIASLEDDMLSAEDKEFILAQTKFLETRQNDHGVVRDLQHAEVMAKLNALQVGGVDVAALAKAVADETALRMKD